MCKDILSSTIFFITFLLCGVDWGRPGMSVTSLFAPCLTEKFLLFPCTSVREFTFFYSEMPNWKERAMSKWGGCNGKFGEAVKFPIGLDP